MKIAIEGCAHGELEKIYNTIQHLEIKQNIKIDLLICCGDFQSTRNEEDLACMACPPKYRDMCSFYKYYSGEKVAPILTIFIGGNHEASSYLQELAYGGWVARNIYYLGYAGVVNIGGIRIGGISGIQKGHDYLKGHFEKAPYTEQTKRSCYHIRNLEIFRLKQLSGKVDIMCSHDWPQGVYHYGNAQQLIKFKPYFKQEIEENKLGSSVCEEVLKQIQPDYWFSAHLHAKFSAVIPHDNGKKTKFLALDKCLPKRRFLQILDIEHDPQESLELKYDLEWLSILYLTNHLLSVKSTYNYMPGPSNATNDRYNFTPSSSELNLILNKFSNNLIIPHNFIQTVQSYSPLNNNQKNNYNLKQSISEINNITKEFCNKLSIDDPLAKLIEQTPKKELINNNSYSILDNSYSSFQNTPNISFNQQIQNKNGDDNINESLLNSLSSPINIFSTKKFKLNLPSPKNNNDNNDKSKNNSSINEKSIILEEEINESTNELTSNIILSAKKFKPYKSKMVINYNNSNLKSISEDKPMCNKSIIEIETNKSIIENDSNVSVLNNLSAIPQSPCPNELPMPNFNNEKELCNINTNKNEEVCKPIIKKFKRRNQSIYKTEDDD